MAKPVTFLNDHLNEKVEILLKDGRVIKGILAGYDDHMNLVLEDTEEETEETKRRVGTIVLRGNNVVTLNPE
ncbi:MAG: LSM domain-containing protein [Thermoplasmatota archaeon]